MPDTVKMPNPAGPNAFKGSHMFSCEYGLIFSNYHALCSGGHWRLTGWNFSKHTTYLLNFLLETLLAGQIFVADGDDAGVFRRILHHFAKSLYRRSLSKDG